MKIRLSLEALEAAKLLQEKDGINLAVLSQAERGYLKQGKVERKVNFSEKIAKKLTGMLRRRKDTVYELKKVKEILMPYTGRNFSKVEFLPPTDDSVLNEEEQKISDTVSLLLVEIVKETDFWNLRGLKNYEKGTFQEE